MLRAFERGLSLSAFELLTPGMIIDYIVTYNNTHLTDEEKADEVRLATQSDFDQF